jgi:hypothetical protein
VAGIAVAAPAQASPGDQDSASYLAEIKAAATDSSEHVDTVTQAHNNGVIWCSMRAGTSGFPRYTEADLIRQLGGDHWATVMVTRAEYHFCPEYS